MTYLDQEIETKAAAAGITLAQAVLLGYAVAKTELSHLDLFEAILRRQLSHVERLALAVLGDEQDAAIENMVGVRAPRLM